MEQGSSELGFRRGAVDTQANERAAQTGAMKEGLPEVGRMLQDE